MARVGLTGVGAVCAVGVGCAAGCAPVERPPIARTPTSTDPSAARIDRTSPLPGVPLTCRANGGFTGLRAEWTVDGEPYVGADGALVGDTVPDGVTREGEQWTCRVALFDGRIGPADAVRIGAPGGNVLVLLVDDIGPAQLGPRTPTIDGLLDAGLSFDAAYTQPVCSPSRAALLTGRYPRRFGIGTALDFYTDSAANLPESERTLAEVLRDAGYATGLFGKWHLVLSTDDDPPADPLDHGFDRFEGLLANLALDLLDDGEDNTYFHWDRSVDGVLEGDERYIVSAQVDDVLGWIARTPEPWFAYVAFTGAHAPFHTPPASLASAPADDSQAAAAASMLEAVDTEIGRLLATVDPEVLARTHVFVAGDNGPPPESLAGSDNGTASKGTVDEGGVRVPLVYVGPAVREPGAQVSAMVHFVDLLPTVADLTGAPLADRRGRTPELDGASLWRFFDHFDAPPVRTMLYDDVFADPGPGPYVMDARSVRDERYKLVYRPLTGERELYEVAPGSVHGPNLFDRVLDGREADAAEALQAELDAWTDRLAP